MSREYRYDEKEAFLQKLEELAAQGIDPADVAVMTPYHVHEAEHLLKAAPSPLKFFALAGGVAGFVLGFVFIIFTVMDWPLVTGGKPLVSIPAFIIVAFECTILLGGIVSFLGFFHLNRLPNIQRIVEPRECGNQFLIVVNNGGGES